MITFEQIEVAILVALMGMSIQQSEAHSSLVSCPVPMQICGHGGLVFPGGGTLHLRAGNVTLECGSSVGPGMNLTILDTNTSGQVRLSNYGCLKIPRCLIVSHAGNFLVEVTGGIIPGGLCSQSRSRKRNSTVTTPLSGYLTLQVGFDWKSLLDGGVDLWFGSQQSNLFCPHRWRMAGKPTAPFSCRLYVPIGW